MKTVTDYKRLMRDRPHKWGSFDVIYTVVAPNPEFRCGKCAHFFTSLVAQRSTCEIFKGRGEERKVPAAGSCMFFTRDGTSFPRMEEGKSKTQEPPGASMNKDSEEKEDAVDK